MASAVSFQSTSTIQPTEEKDEKLIHIDFDKLKPYYAIATNCVGIADFGRDKTMTPACADDLLKSHVSLKDSKFEGTPPISFSYRYAVQFVVDPINKYAKMSDGKDLYLPCFVEPADSIEYDLYCALVNINTPRADLIPSPPQYSGRICSAPRDANNYWLGAILRMLLDQGHIKDYGQKGRCNYWVTL